MWDLGVLAFGVLGLWLGTEVALRETLALAERTGLSQTFLGLTLLAIGTDLPELVVAVDGGFQQLRGIDTSGVVIGNAVGSAVAQASLVLGVGGLVGHLRMRRRVIQRDGLALVLCIALVGLLGADGRITRMDAGALLVAYAIYTGTLMMQERAVQKVFQNGGRRNPRAFLFIAGGLVAVVLSAHLVVERAVLLADEWGIRQSLIGVLLVGAGTSLPELALSLGAAAKGRGGLSVGNVIGSNIFDLLVPIGASGVIHAMSVEGATLWLDLPAMFVVTVAGIAFFVHRGRLLRWEAGTLVGLYVTYAALRLATG